jgi:hypothetical protein
VRPRDAERALHRVAAAEAAHHFGRQVRLLVERPGAMRAGHGMTRVARREHEGNAALGKSVRDREGHLVAQPDVEDRAVQLRRIDETLRIGERCGGADDHCAVALQLADEIARHQILVLRDKNGLAFKFAVGHFGGPRFQDRWFGRR